VHVPHIVLSPTELAAQLSSLLWKHTSNQKHHVRIELFDLTVQSTMQLQVTEFKWQFDCKTLGDEKTQMEYLRDHAYLPSMDLLKMLAFKVRHATRPGRGGVGDQPIAPVSEIAKSEFVEYQHNFRFDDELGDLLQRVLPAPSIYPDASAEDADALDFDLGSDSKVASSLNVGADSPVLDDMDGGGDMEAAALIASDPIEVTLDDGVALRRDGSFVESAEELARRAEAERERAAALHRKKKRKKRRFV
jgi:hypothetical protein